MIEHLQNRARDVFFELVFLVVTGPTKESL